MSNKYATKKLTLSALRWTQFNADVNSMVLNVGNVFDLNLLPSVSCTISGSNNLSSQKKTAFPSIPDTTNLIPVFCFHV